MKYTPAIAQIHHTAHTLYFYDGLNQFNAELQFKWVYFELVVLLSFGSMPFSRAPI